MIYFIQQGRRGPIKIGYTGKTGNDRLRALQTGTHKGLTILGTVDGDKKTEAALHQKFDICRIRGEWFQPHGLLLDYISEACGADDIMHGFEIFGDGVSLDDALQDVEVQQIGIALRKGFYRIDGAARLLGIPVRSLRYRIKKYDIKIESPLR